MPVQTPSEIDELKMVYQEIIEGCSYSPLGFYVKHLCELEQIEMTRKRIETIQAYINQGIPTESEQMDRLKTNEEWSNELEEDIKAYRQTIADNERMMASVIAQQQGSIKKVIDEHKNSLIALLTKRKILIGTTAEDLSDRDGTYFFAYLSLYKDKACKERLFKSWEEFEVLEEREHQKYLEAIDSTITRLNERNVRRVGCLPFFLNAFSYSKESIHTFLSRPICELTNYQVHLFSAGSRNLNILAQAEGSPPDYFDKVTADEILRWYDTQYSIVMGKRRQ